MSGFVSEIAVFLGIATSDVYSVSFKVVITVLAAVGVILSPIYLLSMLRRIFYGDSGEIVNKTPSYARHSPSRSSDLQLVCWFL